MLKLSRLFLAGLTLFLIASAQAAPVTYVLSGVVFNDGGTASGTFTFDPATNLYSAVNIVTTTGSSRTGATYMFVCGQDVPSCTGIVPNSTEVLYLTTTAAIQTGLPALAIFFTGVGGVPPAGAGASPVIDISNSSLAVGAVQEASCVDAACSAPTAPMRASVAGFAIELSSAQMGYAANLILGDSYVDITNGGFAGAALGIGAAGTAGNVCANIYVFDPDQEMIACCSCLTTPDGLYALSVKNDLLIKPLTPATHSAVAIKILSTTATGTANTVCNPALTGTPAFGLLAWGTTLHVGPASTVLTENAYQQVIPGQTELAELPSICGIVLAEGSGFGTCNNMCLSQGLGGVKK